MITEKKKNFRLFFFSTYSLFSFFLKKIIISFESFFYYRSRIFFLKNHRFNDVYTLKKFFIKNKCSSRIVISFESFFKIIVLKFFFLILDIYTHIKPIYLFVLIK
ncbi:hypothetical protein GLOIN_2v1584971 [Rhizophagus irregularis DAOM 181602=DAOM 197198]|uniref:Uncharacterized protein n=1 Tax=Rhizophagus irregularis (strain DAOM 181602 / DAOM 197198 / MUCL 43194) TaxID=747089 RepID=A0A2P4Q7R9_RHIID|nr:hypothetical protein GLOIN_2v1584971 [Rhizophagus irregularis DAOM 181602=DAOM 197198]POG73667.1 hypothetical protein GLOIN_2v1584971 [Rhizophagus irregularis DAOM 181602=DAOM 197198]GET50031.1 hypothetical protein GLOIN_2v1584971 [Rhizophagus irregularis DAOM 181602=DAOM 197198]|eukprot:XP_025180533.1 hypothetical protein GLOIN_2v1584971 [Rhizophagus irregularis DAOM 181602=DAOM 197198]